MPTRLTMLAHFGIVARQRVGAFEQRFHVKLHAIKHRLARCKTRLAMLGANKAQAGEGWLVIKPSPGGRRPRACFFYPWRVSMRQVGATRAGELAAEPSPRSRPAEGGREVALTRSVQRTGAKAGAISPESFVRSRDIWPKAIRHVALSGRVKTCARFKSFPDRVQGTQKRNEQKRK